MKTLTPTLSRKREREWNTADPTVTRRRAKHGATAFTFTTLVVTTVTFALMILGGCSSIAKRESDQETLQRYLDYADEPIDHFNYLGRFDGWRPLGRDKVIVWTGLNEAYLLTVVPTCTELQTATQIGLTSKTGSVTRGFDSVRVGRQRCLITEIRPIDYRRMKEETAQVKRKA